MSKLIYSIPIFYIFKYLYFYYFNDKSNEKDNIIWMKSRLESLEENVNDLTESIDKLEKNIDTLNNQLHESTIKLDNFITSNYDIIEQIDC